MTQDPATMVSALPEPITGIFEMSSDRILDKRLDMLLTDFEVIL